MQAIVFHGIGDIRLDDVPDPRIEQPTDAIVRLTTSAICGTDLHLIRGTVAGMKEGTILGHEGVGVVEEVGAGVRNLAPGDRVVIPSTIACGYCSYCRAGYFSQCDNANPKGKRAGTAFYGGPEESGPFHGLQAELARVPFANVGLVKLPDSVSDDQAILLSDIFPTAYFGAELAEIRPGNTVAIFGCGPVGQLAIESAAMLRAGRIIAVDCIPSRLELARAQEAEVIDFEKEDPVQAILELTGGIGVDRVIDAVGVDAVRPHKGPAAKRAKAEAEEFDRELHTLVPKPHTDGPNWHPGDGPSQALRWAVDALAKAGTHSIIGVYPQTLEAYPIGKAMNRNLTLKMGNCHHRKYIPLLLDAVESGAAHPEKVLTEHESLPNVIDAYKAFDTRQPWWIKVELQPQAMMA
ncbi:MAG TPA: zinc-dependent alcohol dehydrogenase [Gemmatimonadaceae bacterium]|nr:zinc-dependent alcohol dehydrogenase [Gemmatimonadaceae bacterium]